MPNTYLTKLDFKRWMTCPTSAYHGWCDLKSKTDEDAFLAFLAEEGRIIGRAAHRLFDEGKFIEDKSPQSPATLLYAGTGFVASLRFRRSLAEREGLKCEHFWNGFSSRFPRFAQ